MWVKLLSLKDNRPLLFAICFLNTPKLLFQLPNLSPRQLQRCSVLHCGAIGVALLCYAAHPAKADEYQTVPYLKYGDSIYSYKSRGEADVETLGCKDLDDCDLLAGQGEKAGWMDNSHDFVTTNADALAGWMDGFFGTQRNDEETARSYLRLRLQYEWDQEDGHDFKKPALRGKVRLPRADERLGLIFSDDGDEQSTVSEDVDKLLADENPNNEVALQYTGVDRDRSRLDFSVSLPSFKFKSRIRYRYKYPYSESLSGRFTEELIFKDGDGYRASTKFELDKVLNENVLLRWSNRFRYGQRTDGIEWNSSVGLSRRFDDKHAISYFVSVNGKTKPEFISERESKRQPGDPRTTHEKPGWLTEAYGVGMLYRVNFFRRWLFAEIQPAILWRRRFEQEDNRQSVGVITARLEIMFDKEHSE